MADAKSTTQKKRGRKRNSEKLREKDEEIEKLKAKLSKTDAKLKEVFDERVALQDELAELRNENAELKEDLDAAHDTDKKILKTLVDEQHDKIKKVFQQKLKEVLVERGVNPETMLIKDLMKEELLPEKCFKMPSPLLSSPEEDNTAAEPEPSIDDVMKASYKTIPFEDQQTQCAFCKRDLTQGDEKVFVVGYKEKKAMKGTRKKRTMLLLTCEHHCYQEADAYETPFIFHTVMNWEQYQNTHKGVSKTKVFIQ